MKQSRIPCLWLEKLIVAISLNLVAITLQAANETIDRSPVDLVLAKDESWLATVNQTSDSVSLVRVADGTLLDELTIGRRPAAIALHPNGTHILATCSYSGDLHLLEVKNEKLHSVAIISLGFQPNGIAITPDGRSLYVALTDADQVAVIDFNEWKITSRIDVGRWPRYLALSNDQTRLAVATSGDRGISVIDTETQKLLHIDRFVGLNIGHMQLSRDGNQVYFPWMVYRRNPISERNIRLGWVMASRLGRICLDDTARREAISLDAPGKAVADPHGLAITSDEGYVVISASGTHELLVLKVPGLPFQDRGSTDHIDEQLLRDDKRFYRIELGGRPMGLRISNDDRTVYIANYLDNSIQVVNLVARTIVRRIDLGGDATPSLARQGEAIFFDARRSLDQWYSCHSCHYEGGSNAVVMDTMNDGTQFSFKTVLPLYQLEATGPWTWHGWQSSLSDAMKHSFKTTMLGPNPSDTDLAALRAYLASLQSPPNPFRKSNSKLSESAHRGEKIFSSSLAACATCHKGQHYTDGKIHDIGLGNLGDAYLKFNTPSLIGVFRKVALLHDGRAASLTELLQGPHSPERVAGSKLSEEELNDLVEFLKSL